MSFNFDLVLTIVAAACSALISIVSSSPPERHQPRKPFKLKIWALSVLAMVATVCLYVRSQQNIQPEMVPNQREWTSPTGTAALPALFVAGQEIMLRQGMVVQSGTAKNIEFYAWAFMMYGEPTPEMQREAVKSFRKYMIDNAVMPETPPQKAGFFKDTPLVFDQTQISDLIHGRAVLYAMAYAKYQNRQGLTLETRSFAFMEPPQDRDQTGFSKTAWHMIAAN